ncbi:DNA repair protein RecO [Flexibacterium corallicola]|uniref:DNA repair protein RecO n=1 Tax=Flexibacterium corallicola TaxID=3037259 RepID=UPI00286F0315|nr:DNA repair protein RecO [Pseudovibrio sp. M1P-2-3]
MQWSGEGIVIATKKQGNSNLLLEVITKERGRWVGLVRGGRSRKKQPTLQLGNQLHLTWKARLHEQLGFFTAEPINLRAATLMQSALSLYGLQSICALLHLLPERDPHTSLYSALDVVLDHLEDYNLAAALMARFELQLLNELGFGLDLTECAATGTVEDLIWVSPKSGRAVNKEAGAPWKDKLLPLPSFLRNIDSRSTIGTHATPKDVQDAFHLTGYFLFRHIYEPRNITWPLARDSFVKELKKQVETSAQA